MHLFLAVRAGDGIRTRKCLLGKRTAFSSPDQHAHRRISAMASSGCGSGADFHGRTNRPLDGRDSVGSIHVCHSQPPPRTSHMHPRQDLPAIHEVVE